MTRYYENLPADLAEQLVDTEIDARHAAARVHTDRIFRWVGLRGPPAERREQADFIRFLAYPDRVDVHSGL